MRAATSQTPDSSSRVADRAPSSQFITAGPPRDDSYVFRCRLASQIAWRPRRGPSTAAEAYPCNHEGVLPPHGLCGDFELPILLSGIGLEGVGDLTIVGLGFRLGLKSGQATRRFDIESTKRLGARCSGIAARAAQCAATSIIPLQRPRKRIEGHLDATIGLALRLRRHAANRNERVRAAEAGAAVGDAATTPSTHRAESMAASLTSRSDGMSRFAVLSLNS